MEARSDALAALSGLALEEIDRSIFAPVGAVAQTAHYDRMGRVYDLACGTRLYQRVVWGTTPERSRAFASRIFSSRDRGPHVEVGCGGLLFTSHLYDEDRGRACILIDPSVAMLRIARTRLVRRHGRVPSHVVLLRGNGLRLPLPSEFAATVLSMHVLHVLADRRAFLRALQDLARTSESTIGLTSLVLTGTFRDRFLSALHRMGELGEPMTSDALIQLAHDSLRGDIETDADGAMRFLTAFAATPPSYTVSRPVD